jgi:uncharacterized protein
MKTEVAQKIIAEWLFETTLPDLIKREVSVAISEPGKGPVCAVIGPRRAGKTFLLYQTIKSLLDSGIAKEDMLFLDFEDYRLKGFQPDDIEAIFEGFQRLAKRSPRYLFFDEIQQVPDWSRLLRTLHNQRRYAIIVTGSNSSLLTRDIATELRGRYQDVFLMPFSFKEYLALRKIEWGPSVMHTSRKGVITGAFEEWLFNGGYPEVCALPTPAARRRLLQNYFETVFYHDIIDRYGVKTKDLLEGIMMAMVNGTGELFSVSAYSRQLEKAEKHGSKRSIATYLRYLQEAFFILTSEKFSWSARKRTMNPEKVYLVDNGFTQLAVSGSENRGKLLESVVAQELFRRGNHIYYYKGKNECDVIAVEDNRPAAAWQVCWEVDEKNEKREIAGILEAMQTLKIKSGGIITGNQEGNVKTDDYEIKLVPIIGWLLG